MAQEHFKYSGLAVVFIKVLSNTRQLLFFHQSTGFVAWNSTLREIQRLRCSSQRSWFCMTAFSSQSLYWQLLCMIFIQHH